MNAITNPPVTLNHAAIARGLEFFSLLYQPDDWIQFRPMELMPGSNGKPKHRPCYKERLVKCHRASLLRQVYPILCLQSARANASVYFGCCPRFGSEGYELAAQVRRINFYWADIDDAKPVEAVERCKAAGLPHPSVVVSSGRGTHLYWALERPIVIDDAADPPQVNQEWIERDGKRKPRQFYERDGERIYLADANGRAIAANSLPLSDKATFAQDVLAGIATKIGGDHTKDVSRLLRGPGSFNLKDKDNPTLCEVVEMTGTKYPASLFDPFADHSPDLKRRQQIAAIPLPSPKRIGGNRLDRMNERIAHCGIAPPGQRSEVDFAFCCYAVEQGVSTDDAWAMVADIGKFKDAGRPYFDRTWGKAAEKTRETIYQRLERKASASASSPSTNGSDHNEEDEEGLIRHNPQTMTVGSLMCRVTDALLGGENLYVRAEVPVIVDGATITPLDSTAAVAALLNSHSEFQLVEIHGESVVSRFEPLPEKYAKTWIHHKKQRRRIPTIKLFTRNPVYTVDDRPNGRLEVQLVKPGYNRESGIYYAGPEVSPLTGTKHLDTLLQDFCWRDAKTDRANYVGILLTVVLMPRFIGSKPAVLFLGNQPELGKTILAQNIAIVRDGEPVKTLSFLEKDEEFEKRIGSVVRSGVTTIIVDNAKRSGRRHAVIDSGCLERCITDKVLSFRLLGYSADITAENSHIFCITANGPDVSPDLLTRSVPINLFHAGDPKRRSFSMLDPEGYAIEHRAELLGELLGMVEVWKSKSMPRAKDAPTRFNKCGWGHIVGGVLQANGFEGFLSNSDAVASELDPTRRDFEALVAHVLAMASDNTPKKAVDWVRAAVNRNLLHSELGEGSDRSRATRMGFILSKEL